jgi:predicted Zn-dependent peptidase
VGLYVTAGTRDETRSSAGINHFLKYAAYGSTTNKPGYQVVHELEAAGATLNASAGREHMLFSSEFPPTSVDTVVPLEADPVANVLELVHRQAYRNKGLGQPLNANKNDVHRISRGNIASWVHSNYLPNKSVVVGVGMTPLNISD